MVFFSHAVNEVFAIFRRFSFQGGACCFGILGVYSVFGAFPGKLLVFTALAALLYFCMPGSQWPADFESHCKAQSTDHELFPDMCVAKAPRLSESYNLCTAATEAPPLFFLVVAVLGVGLIHRLLSRVWNLSVASFRQNRQLSQITIP